MLSSGLPASKSSVTGRILYGRVVVEALKGKGHPEKEVTVRALDKLWLRRVLYGRVGTLSEARKLSLKGKSSSLKGKRWAVKQAVFKVKGMSYIV
jgi:hypothetical protein